MWSELLTLLAVSSTAQGLDWDAAYSKAQTALSSLTQDEKLGIVTGVTWMKGPCVGNTSPVSKIGFPSLCLQDGPLGVRYVQKTTAWPAGINAAATWNKKLIYDRANGLGSESKALGVNVHLGPVSGALGKFPQAGRNWEGFGPDPYLAGVAMVESITGMQDAGVQACAKHYLLNEQELNRETIDTSVDDRTLHELYLWPFADSVHADVATIMCSYNKNAGNWICENDHLLNDILKGELGYKGLVVSDWNAQHSTTLSANSGLDMTMPGSDFNNPPGSIYWGSRLGQAISNGQVPQSRLDDMVTRVLASWYGLGQDQNYPPVTWSSWNGGNGGPDVQGNHKVTAREVATESVILLKNTNGSLPLNKPKSIAIIGQNAIQNPNGINSCTDKGCNTGHLAQGWGSGSAEFPYLVAPLDAIKPLAAADGTNIVTSTTDNTAAAASAAAQADVALVFITADSGEGYITVEGNAGDRNNLDPWHNGNDLVKAVANVNKKTIVVVNSVGAVILETILAQPNVVAVVWAGIAGQESGNGVADVLYGKANPSGKLPYTIAKSPSDYGVSITAGPDNFKEGLYIDYRHFDNANIEPRYEFGYGLSYTTFNYSSLAVSISSRTGPTTGQTIPGGAADLFESVGTVSATISNTGPVAGAEVAQLYITLPSSAPASPPKQLRGFEKLNLAAGASGKVEFQLRRKDISYWDTSSKKWVVPSGEFTVRVGSSSRQLPLEGTFSAGGN